MENVNNIGNITTLGGALKSIVNSLLGTQPEEPTNNLAFEYLLSNASQFDGPDSINYSVTSKAHKLIATWAEFAQNTSLLSPDKKHLLISIYQNWHYFSNHIRTVCEKFYGGAFSLERTRWLLSNVINWCITDEVPYMLEEYNGGLCHWIPETGTWEQWLNYVIGISELYYGDPAKYLTEYRVLMAVRPEIQKVQYTKHKL